MIRKIRQRVAKVQIVTADQQLQVGPLQFQVLWPTVDARPNPRDKNADSIVLYGKIGKSNWLFTGDADQVIERSQVLPRQLKADFLKARHHGSKTSSDPAVVASLDLKTALISAGVANRYGHPHRETLETFAKAGVPAVSTHEQGMIWVESSPYRQEDELFSWLKIKESKSHAGP
ncbi:putative truncated hydrolase [Lacticaseibacillus casei DSM 20011 = JCM 1134 = ATCC 393]|uniref:Truncated hydrolase n=1 Tax=Lacticaseibacillus casei DSM 20011 = JCM 1134 = ATCC 393 TaxID=1423732 RepID=A0AAD1APJ3_LACCA|nr:putative truncated hydrolase [Lacticaseibacillus casei DSM 20011 = JCM 1134 = ATCC 393]